MRLRLLAAAAATAVLPLAPAVVGPPASAATSVKVDYVVDGDTIRLANGKYVRLIGIDTPETGQCGYQLAKRKLDRMIGARASLRNPRSVVNKDRYGRLLRYVHAGGRDTGAVQLRRGLAKARYDGLDGYDPHPRQARYHRLDRKNPDHTC